MGMHWARMPTCSFEHGWTMVPACLCEHAWTYVHVCSREHAWADVHACSLDRAWAFLPACLRESSCVWAYVLHCTSPARAQPQTEGRFCWSAAKSGRNDVNLTRRFRGRMIVYLTIMDRILMRRTLMCQMIMRHTAFASPSYCTRSCAGYGFWAYASTLLPPLDTLDVCPACREGGAG